MVFTFGNGEILERHLPFLANNPILTFQMIQSCVIVTINYLDLTIFEAQYLNRFNGFLIFD